MTQSASNSFSCCKGAKQYLTPTLYMAQIKKQKLKKKPTKIKNYAKERKKTNNKAEQEMKNI